MIKTSIEKLAGEIGFDIGASDDTVQSDLLNGFCKGLYNSMNDDNNRETQICYIVDKLTPKSKLIISKIYDFIATSNENN